ncbi:MAG: 3-hydroxyacyl-ACP dehydratase FabZ [Thermoguttaceae bacterium]
MDSESKLQEILDSIPHRFPFLFVDEILEHDEQRIYCRKTFTNEEPFFQGHYPQFPIVPGVILCESVMQCGALLLSKTLPKEEGQLLRVPVVAKMGEVRFKQMVRPGDSVMMEVQLRECIAGIYFLRGKSTLDGKTILQFDFACSLADPPKQ